MAFLCWFRHCKMMRGFNSQSDSSANTAALRPDMHFYSGQMSAFLQALRIVCVAQKKVSVPLARTEKRPKTFRGFDFSPTEKYKSRYQTLPNLEAGQCLTLTLTSCPNRLTERYIHIVTLESERLSRQKQNGPQGLSCPSRSHRHSLCVSSCMRTWLLMK